MKSTFTPSFQRREGLGIEGPWIIAQRWSSHAHHGEKVAVLKSSTFSKGLHIVCSSRQGPRRPVVQNVGNASKDSDATTHFFYDELIEAKTTVQQKIEGQLTSVDQFHPGPTEEEGASQREEDADSENPPETICESGTSKWDVRQDWRLADREECQLSPTGLLWSSCNHISCPTILRSS